MTDKQDPITHAARLLREAAEELRQAHTYHRSEGWQGETGAQSAYDVYMAAAQALEDWEAAVGAGGVQALSAAPDQSDGRKCYLCGHPASAHPMEPDPRGGMRRGGCPPGASHTPPAEQQAAPNAAPGESAAIKMVGYGGCTGINDYLMSDGTIKTMRPHEVVWREAPQQAVAGGPVANDIHGALTAAAIYLTNAQRQYGKDMHRQAIASLEKAKRAVAQAADFAKAAPQQEAQEPYGYVFAEQYAPTVGSELKTTREVFTRVKPDRQCLALYTAPPAEQQAQPGAVLKAIREANMQLVRTGDDAFMLVPYKVATTEAAAPKAGVTTEAALGGVYAELPRAGAIGYASVVDVDSYVTRMTIGPRLPGVRDIALWTTDQLRDFADRTHALRMQAAPKAAPGEPIAWTPGPNLFKDWCAQWFGPDSDDDYLAKAVFNLPPMAQVFKEAAPQQEAQEPVAVPRFNCWSTNEGDSWFDHPADSQAIYDCLGDDAKVGDEYELTAGWQSVTARYRITEVVGDGEEYEVECISHPQANTAPQPAPAPLSDDVLRDAEFEAVRKKLCALPRFSFLSDGYGVRRVPDKSGSWIAFDAAHELFDPVAVDAARKQGVNHD